MTDVHQGQTDVHQGQGPGPAAHRTREIRIGARRSPLARAQADQVAAGLQRAGFATRYVPIVTHGDTDRRELVQIGGTGVFTGAVREALRSDQIDVGVHSLKDLPTAALEGLSVAAYLARDDTRDVLVGRRLDQLTSGASVGTGAPRRAVQLEDWAAERGFELDVRPVRGNVGTRLDLVARGEVDAVVLAAAGLHRLGLLDLRGETSDAGQVVVRDLPAVLLDEDVMLPAPGQGAIACEVSVDLDPAVRAAVEALDDPRTRAEVSAERRFLAVLEAGCTAPVGARAVVKSVRDTSTDLTLAAVIGRTLGVNLPAPTESGSYTPPELARRQLNPASATDLVVRVSGSGSSSGAADVGERLARSVLGS